VLSIAALALAAATAPTSADTLSTNPWWEKITITYGDDGSHRACDYQTSRSFGSPEACDSETTPVTAAKASISNAGVQTKITFERSFTPGAMPNLRDMAPGDKLIGGLVMMVAIDRNGSVQGCSVVAETGDEKPEYGCEQVRAEKFQASLGGAQDSQLGTLTVLVYGHKEEVV
jgi:hypothetical protein